MMMIDAAGILFVAGLPPHRRALFLRRTAEGDLHGTWALPGGKIEAGETPLQAALREAREEMGNVLPPGTPILTARHRLGTVDYRTFLQRCNGPFEPELNEEHDDFIWAPLDAPPAPLHPGLALILSAESSTRPVGIAADAAPRRIVSPTGRDQVLHPIRPNPRLKARFQDRLEKIIEDMQRSTLFWIKARWRSNPPTAVMAMDESPADALRRKMDELSRQWQRNFNQAAEELAGYFATEAFERSDARLRSILRRAGISVRFRMTPAARDALKATIGEQVGLIRSIPQQHLQAVQGLVMRSVTTGRDLGTLTREIEERYHKTRKRAALIARDQSNKATATITRVRYNELGIQQARWLHSRAGKEPREAHVAFSQGRYWGKVRGPIYNVMDGMVFHDRKGKVLDGGRVFPGTAVNCRCVARPIIPGFNS